MGRLAAFVLDLKSAKIETPTGIAFFFFFFKTCQGAEDCLNIQVLVQLS